MYLRSISRFILKLFGWHLEGEIPPNIPKFVLIAAPHTSNWDFPLSLLGCLILGLKINWMGKKSMFRWPVARLFKKMGGIPIIRTSKQSMVAQMTAYFDASDQLTLLISPEGTRQKKTSWKSGFYYIALNAKVPVVCAFIDYKKKKYGVGPVIWLTGDIKKDMQLIERFYAPIQGKYPELKSDIALKT